MSVTVVIVNFNSGALLAECLKHLYAQSIRPEKIVVVDNDSSDSSADAAELFSDVVLYKLTKNLGFAGGNNFALERSDTDFIALLNPDAFPEPNWLEHLLAAAAQFPEVVAFGSRQLCNENSTLIDGIGDRYHFSGLVWRDRHGMRQLPKDLKLQEIFSPCAAAALYRRQALADVGQFDEDYFCYVEDVDLGFRLRLAGHKSMYVPNAVVRHVGSATTGGQRSDFSVYYGHRNLVWTFVKNMPGVLFWCLLPIHVLLNVVTIGMFTLRGQGKVILGAKKDALCGLARAWAKRKSIQSRRSAKVADIWLQLDKSFFLGKRKR